MIDDSALFHAGTYDPAKAREYYLRTRKLKGRPVASGPSNSGRAGAQLVKSPAARAGGVPNRSKTKSRQVELQAQKEALKKRLDRLREELQKLVVAAKARNDANQKPEPKDAAPETKADKADRNKAEKKDKPETASEKKERAKKAKEAYEKEHPTSLSQDVEILQAQVEDIQAKIQQALSDARERRNKAGQQDSRSGSKITTDGPRGR